MKVSSVADDKIIEIKNFKKVNGEIINVKRKRTKKDKKKPDIKVEENDMADDDEDFDDEVLRLMEEIEILQIELFKEKVRRQTIEKLLNKLLKQQQKNKDKDDE